MGGDLRWHETGVVKSWHEMFPLSFTECRGHVVKWRAAWEAPWVAESLNGRLLKWTDRKFGVQKDQQVRRRLPSDRSFVTHSSREEGALDARQGHTGRPQGSWRQREGRAVQTRDLTEVSVEGVDKAGWAAEDWMVWIVPEGSRAQGPSLVVWNLLRVERTGGWWPRGWDPVEEGEGGGWALGQLFALERCAHG